MASVLACSDNISASCSELIATLTLLRRTQHLQVLESCCPLVTHRSTCAPTGSACGGGRRRSHDVLDSSGGLRLHFCDGFRVYTDATMSFTNFCPAITSSSYRRATHGAVPHQRSVSSNNGVRRYLSGGITELAFLREEEEEDKTLQIILDDLFPEFQTYGARCDPTEGLSNTESTCVVCDG
ncbi:unnamed protein product [Musa banksii]